MLARLELARQNGYREVEGQSLIELGLVHWRTERYADARAHQLAAVELHSQALTIAREIR